MTQVPDQTIKMLLIGSAAVGKTSLINKYVHGKFRKDYVLTIGMEPYSKYETIKKKQVCFHIFDIAGQQQFSRLRKMFYRGSRGALVVFDLTRQQTFDDVRTWVEDARTVEPKQEFILVGNKADLTGQRKVEASAGQKLAEELGCLDYIETSAKTGTKVNTAFKTLGKKLVFA